MEFQQACTSMDTELKPEAGKKRIRELMLPKLSKCGYEELLVVALRPGGKG